jgi:hypothetical protein
MVPSSVTMPTDTLFAEPSTPMHTSFPPFIRAVVRASAAVDKPAQLQFKACSDTVLARVSEIGYFSRPR